MQKQAVRLGVDIGGTFTDVVLERGGALFSTKVLTTYRAPEEAIVEGMARVCAQAQINPGEITQIIHGTTLATNALIERRGAKTALITTEGFRDVIEMRTESRFEQYDLNLTLPPPLLPRNFRYTITERMQADGQVLKPINRAEIEALVGEIKQAGFESIAVGFYIPTLMTPMSALWLRLCLRKCPAPCCRCLARSAHRCANMSVSTPPSPMPISNP